MIKEFIAFVLSNFTLTFLVIGLIFSIVAIARAPKPTGADVIVDKLLAWFVFWSIGISFLYNAVFHMFFGEMAAKFIGWADSPFQFEVGTASLGMSVIGFIAAFRSFDLRLGAVIPFAIFMLGAGAGHIREIVTAHNFAPGNAGVIFYTDFLIPVFGFALLWLQHRYGRPASIERHRSV
jgi:hypothetical protein